MRRFRILLAAGIVGLCTACAPVNSRQATYDYRAGYRFGNCSIEGNPDEVFIVLTFSGGGTRAAAFSYGVLKELHETKVTVGGEERRLLDEVDVISAVSGGAFTAAYYGLYGDRIFQDFESKFLNRNIQFALTLRLLSPWNWFRLASPYFSRIDLAAEYYDDYLFDRKTFAKLEAEAKRPFILINATDLSLGTRFEFTQGQFDLLASDLSNFPIARAVAASSAFPGLLSPLRLRNYEKTEYEAPMWMQNAIEFDLEDSPRRFIHAMHLRSYLDVDHRPYIHLVDGGVADNIGLRGPLHSLMFPDNLVSGALQNITDGRELNLQRMLADGTIKRLVFIIVDAKPGMNTPLDRCESTPGLLDVMVSVATAPVGNYSFETVQLLQEYLEDRETLLSDEPDRVKTYIIRVQFDSIKNEKKRQRLSGLGTNFNLDRDAVGLLIETGAELLRESDTFRNGLLKDLHEQR